MVQYTRASENESSQSRIYSPSLKAARERNRFCNLQKERLCGKNCQIRAVTFPPKTKESKMMLQGRREVTPTPQTLLPQRTHSKLPTSWTQPKAREHGSRWRESIQASLQEHRAGEESIEYTSRVKCKLFGLEIDPELVRLCFLMPCRMELKTVKEKF